ncbi:acVLRF1 family peptidyl-tRNA hydrolase [Nocardioides sp. AE5]|uniref:acVLRF1 family peptidyl-tRNA hydrolase n=1 Tax=Nocardioides sp. AE5 TaxID=2962573 RepID=UPI002881C84C|nr:acVLRF1 family peptidyl-tRNA hydrolase [Nocardioides sp. AE5]MDT0203621.1 acVLRF1 family peptidyl-tRNA hydrolase [Nocardioides sp. AE5]
MTSLTVPPTRLHRWVENFTARHGATALAVVAGALTGRAEDGSSFTAHLPFDRPYDDAPEVDLLVAACTPPEQWGVLLVRKGGFAVARLRGGDVVESKVGQRHVQGRTKAGGQSQQRFARRRDNQARQAYAAAAGHAVRILSGTELVVTGGDRSAISEVLDHPGLAHLRPCSEVLAVADPRRAVLESAIIDAMSVRMTVVNT